MSIKQDIDTHPSIADLESDLEASAEKSPDLIVPSVQPKGSEFTPASCMVLGGAFAVMFCSVGFINAFGVFQEYYKATFLKNKSASDIAWVGSFEIFVMFAGTLPIGYLSDKFGPRIPVITGSVMVVFSMFMTSLCTEYYQFFLAQGLALGLGISLVILPAFAVVPRIFVASRGLALGIVVSGSSLGGVIWPIALQRLFKEVGFGWAVRIIAFIMLPLLAFACVVIRIPGSKSSKSGPRPSPDLSVIKHPVLILLSTALFFVYLGLFAPLFYLTGWTISLGLDADMAFYMVSIANGASLFGRVLPGLMADRLGPFNIMIICTLLSSIVCMAWTAATSMVGIIFISLAYGFGSGAVIGLQGVCASQVVKASEYGIAMGFIMSILSIAGLIGSPINGQILERWGYLGISLFSGLAMIIGVVIMAIARLRANPKLLSIA